MATTRYKKYTVQIRLKSRSITIFKSVTYNLFVEGVKNIISNSSLKTAYDSIRGIEKTHPNKFHYQIISTKNPLIHTKRKIYTNTFPINETKLRKIMGKK